MKTEDIEYVVIRVLAATFIGGLLALALAACNDTDANLCLGSSCAPPVDMTQDAAPPHQTPPDASGGGMGGCGPEGSPNKKGCPEEPVCDSIVILETGSPCGRGCTECEPGNLCTQVNPNQLRCLPKEVSCDEL